MLLLEDMLVSPKMALTPIAKSKSAINSSVLHGAGNLELHSKTKVFSDLLRSLVAAPLPAAADLYLADA
jgi:hypothetical protein